MDSAVSVSKGCFLFKNGFNKNAKHKKKTEMLSLFEKQFEEETWYESFKEMWFTIENRIHELNSSMYNKILHDIVNYVKDCYNSHSTVFYDDIIPCATLLTGINQPDHIVQFNALKEQLISKVTSHVAVIYSQDASTLKQIVENMVLQFVNADCSRSDADDSMDSPIKEDKEFKIKKSHSNMTTLVSWYEDLYNNSKVQNLNSPLKKTKSLNTGNQLVVIIPDFESFNCEVLQNLIMILSGHSPRLRFVLIFGVATAVSAIHKSFPYDVSSKLYVQVFQSHTSIVYLNQILENIFLTEKCPFHLSGKPFKLLVDVFLFYDFSVIGFIQNLKYCMMEHYYSSNINFLCCLKLSLPEKVAQLNRKDLERVRHLPSFRPYVESMSASSRIALLTDNEYFSIELTKALMNLHTYMENFHLTLKLLLTVVAELPNTPLGRQIRELYAFCTSCDVTEIPEYKQCVTYLGFLSKEEIVEVISQCINILNNTIEQVLPSTPKKRHSLSLKKIQDNEPTKKYKAMISVREKLTSFKNDIMKSSLERSNIMDEIEPLDANEKINRKKLKEVLMKSTVKEKKAISEFESVRDNFLDYFTEIVRTFLKPPHTQPFHELFFFTDVYKVKRHIVGSPRASIHTALNNPVSYLQCSCCKLSNNESIVSSLPDISIIYKLHLECGKLINLYDWLQAFLTIVDPVETDDNDDEDRREVDPEIQARFTRAVSELQFLGFIKTSKRKTDHVSRLTW